MGIGFIWCAFDILRVLRWARLAIGARDDIDELSVRVQQPRSLVGEFKPKIYMWHTPSIVLRKHVRAKCVCAFFLCVCSRLPYHFAVVVVVVGTCFKCFCHVLSGSTRTRARVRRFDADKRSMCNQIYTISTRLFRQRASAIQYTREKFRMPRRCRLAC